MSSDRFSRFNPHVILDVDEPEHLKRRTDGLNESLYNTAHESKQIPAQKAHIKELWTQDLEECDGDDAAYVDEDIGTEGEESELVHERARMT